MASVSGSPLNNWILGVQENQAKGTSLGKAFSLEVNFRHFLERCPRLRWDAPLARSNSQKWLWSDLNMTTVQEKENRRKFQLVIADYHNRCKMLKPITQNISGEDEKLKTTISKRDVSPALHRLLQKNIQLSYGVPLDGLVRIELRIWCKDESSKETLKAYLSERKPVGTKCPEKDVACFRVIYDSKHNLSHLNSADYPATVEFLVGKMCELQREFIAILKEFGNAEFNTDGAEAVNGIETMADQSTGGTPVPAGPQAVLDAADAPQNQDEANNVLMLSALEGAPREIAHVRRERNQKLVASKKRQYLNTNGCLRCEVCGFDFNAFYGSEVGGDFAECHHTKQLSDRNEAEVTSIDDLAIVCSNCHCIIHRRKDLFLSVDELRQIVRRQQG